MPALLQLRASSVLSSCLAGGSGLRFCGQVEEAEAADDFAVELGVALDELRFDREHERGPMAAIVRKVIVHPVDRQLGGKAGNGRAQDPNAAVVLVFTRFDELA